MKPRVVVVAAVVICDDAVLMTLRRPKAHLGGLWEFPGGKLESGEAPEHALVRECREEIGVEIRVDEILDVAHHDAGERELILLFYRAAIVSGEVTNLEVADHHWVRAGAIDSYPVPPADARVIAKVKRILESA